MYRSLLILFSIVAFTFVSCSDDAVVNEFHDIPEPGWSYDQVLVDSFDVVDTAFYHQYYLNIRIDSDYGFSNIYVKMTETDPNGEETSHVLNVTLAEPSGKWKGSGLGDVLTYQVPVLKKREFKQSGRYSVKLEQYMREEKLLRMEILPHVLSVGIKLEKQEEIF